MDYRESRHYQFGDDIRNMDWRTTARTGHAHIKIFDEERERPVIVVADFTRGLFFASRGRFKSVLVAQLAALIGWLTIARGHRIGAVLCYQWHRELQPVGGRRGQMRLIQALLAAADPERGLQDPLVPDALTQSLLRLKRIARPGSHLFLLSDFQTLREDSLAILKALTHHHQITAIQILDPLDLAPPPPARYGVQDGNQHFLWDLTNRNQYRAYQAYCEQQQARIHTLFTSCQIPITRCFTHDQPWDCINHVLATGY
jgi:uncharacterized protein (DUF58 family)